MARSPHRVHAAGTRRAPKRVRPRKRGRQVPPRRRSLFRQGLQWIRTVWRTIKPRVTRRWNSFTVVVRTATSAAWPQVLAFGRWLYTEVKDVALCYSAVLAGVSGSMAIPSLLLTQIGWLPLKLPLSTLTLAVIAAVVCDRRALPNWRRAARQRLGDRLLRAFSDGVLWMIWWRKIGTPATRL